MHYGAGGYARNLAMDGNDSQSSIEKARSDDIGRRRRRIASHGWGTFLTSGVALALSAWIVAASGSGPHLRYSVGDLVRSEIVTPEPFSVVDPARTEARRVEAAERVVPIFSYDADKNTQAIDELRSSISRLASALESERAGEEPPAPQDFAAAHLADFPLGDEQLLTLLARKGFDPVLVDAVVRALERRSSGPLVADDVAAVSELQVRDVASGDRYPLYFRNVTRLSAAKEALRADLVEIPGLTPLERRQLGAVLEGLISATLVPDEAATASARRAAREAIGEVRDEYQAGQIVAYRNQRVDDRIERAIEELRARSRTPNRLARWAGLFVALAVVSFALWRRRDDATRAGLSPRRAYLLATLLLLAQLAIVRFGLSIVEGLGSLPSAPAFDAGPYYVYAVPIAVAPLVAALLVDGALGLATGLVAAPLLAMLTAAYPGGGLAFGIYAAAAAVVAARGSRRYHSRFEVVRAALLLCAAQSVVAGAAVALVGDGEVDGRRLLGNVGLAAFGGVLAGALSAIVLPAAERLFHVLSDVRLLELANADHELLRRLAIDAPGTHQHSYVMSSVATEAAKAIGANPLLVRIGAYFHDVGKLHAPEMFVENQRGGPNPHDALEPAESARIIIRHVSYGVELARAAGIPPQVRELITGHHGTRTLHFFLEKARRRAADGQEVDESLFRYPGPKPQTKESAILMLADGAEAAVRSLDEPTRETVEAIVRKIADTVVADNQLDECGITLAEVARVREAIVETLLDVHHRRVKYPGFNPPPASRPAGSAVPTSDLDARAPETTK